MSSHRLDDLTLLLDGELDRASAAELTQHVTGCAACQADLAELRALDEMLGAPEPLPLGLGSRLGEIPASVGRPATPLPFRFAAAAIVLVVLGAALLWDRPDEASSPKADPTGGTTSVDVAVEPAPTPQEHLEAALLAGTSVATAYLDELGDAAREGLFAATRSPDPSVARAALRRLGAQRYPGALPVLRDALTRGPLQRTAIAAIGLLGDERAVPILEPYLDAESTHALAVRSIARIGGEGAAEVLATRIENGHARQLIEALAGLGVDGSARILANLAADGGAHAVYAQRAAQGAQATLVPGLLRVAAGQNVREASRALALLERLAPADAVAALAALLDRPTQRMGAARVLARIDTPEAARALLTAERSFELHVAFKLAGRGAETALLAELKHDDWRRRKQAIELLGMCGGDAAVESLQALASDRALAPAALASIGRIGSERAVVSLEAMAGDRRLAADAVTALGVTGRADAVPAILRLAKRSSRLRRTALDALTQIPLPEAVAGIVQLDGRRHLRSPTNHALRQMDAALVKRTLTAMLDTDHAAGARDALLSMARRGSRGAP